LISAHHFYSVNDLFPYSIPNLFIRFLSVLGFIKTPTTKDSELLNVSPNRGKKSGAEPYDGPDRPELY